MSTWSKVHQTFCKQFVTLSNLVHLFSAKLLRELILPVETRIDDVRNFLMTIDSTLTYEVVPIQDPFGPTQSDPNLDVSFKYQI